MSQIKAYVNINQIQPGKGEKAKELLLAVQHSTDAKIQIATKKKKTLTHTQTECKSFPDSKVTRFPEILNQQKTLIKEKDNNQQRKQQHDLNQLN